MEKLIHILESQQFNKAWLGKELFPLAREMEKVVEAGEADICLAKE